MEAATDSLLLLHGFQVEMVLFNFNLNKSKDQIRAFALMHAEDACAPGELTFFVKIYIRAIPA
jgi:hypothetical protein